MTAPLPERVRVGKVVLVAQKDRYGAWYGDDKKGLSVGYVAGLSSWCAVMAVAGGQYAYADTPQAAADALTARLVELKKALEEVLG